MSSRSLNKVQLIGNLTRDPELRYTPQGTPVCTMGIATNRSWVDSSSQRQEETEFHRVVAWSKLAELCAQLLFKSRKVFVEGRLQTRRWTSSDGNERQTTEVVIDDMIILDNRRRDGGRQEYYTEETSAGDSVTSDDSDANDDSAESDESTDDKKSKKSSKKEVKEKDMKEEKEENDEISAEDLDF